MPLVAAGGIVDGRGIAAALALGADGVQMGTRFIATEECNAHPRYKRLVLDGGEGDAMAFALLHHPARALNTPVVRKAREMEAAGVPDDEIRAFVRGRAKAAAHDGDLDEGVFYSGAGVCLVDDLPDVSTLMSRLITELDEAVRRLSALAGAGS